MAGRFTHHLELHAESDIDDEVREWLQEAWEAVAQNWQTGQACNVLQNLMCSAKNHISREDDAYLR